jgi:hypothetical protein
LDFEEELKRENRCRVAELHVTPASTVGKEEVMRYSAVALCGLLLAGLAAVPAEAAYQVGDPIANFTLNDAYGNPVSLYDFQDTVILLNFWQDT